MEDELISLVQCSVEPGQPEVNLQRMLLYIDAEKRRGAALIVFPELCIPGYMVGDRWLEEHLLHRCLQCNQSLIAASTDTTIIWGNIVVDHQNKNNDGSVRKYNAAYIASHGSLLETVCKTHLPTYAEFYDARYFTSGKQAAAEQGKTLNEALSVITVSLSDTPRRIGITICEDLWWRNYGTNPAEILRSKGAEILINLSCSPWHSGKHEERNRVFQSLFSTTPGLPLLVCNAVGVQDIGKTLLVFDGQSSARLADGSVLQQATAFQEDILRIGVSTLCSPACPSSFGDPALRDEVASEHVYQALVTAIKCFCKRIGKTKAVLGLSGGIDSAVSAALCAVALGPENVYAVNLSTQFNAPLTQQAARDCAHALGIHFAAADIDPLVQKHISAVEAISFSPDVPIRLSPLDRENVQSRTRGATVLAGLAGPLAAAIVCNGNKTEMAFGYCTLYGDVIGALCPLGDLLKMQIYELGRTINRQSRKNLIPSACFTVTPSAELSADQAVELQQGDPFWYPYHDQLARAFTEEHCDANVVQEWYKDGSLEVRFGLEPGTVQQHFPTATAFCKDLQEKWQLFRRSVYKRLQAPPIVKISRRSFGSDLLESQIL